MWVGKRVLAVLGRLWRSDAQASLGQDANARAACARRPNPSPLPLGWQQLEVRPQAAGLCGDGGARRGMPLVERDAARDDAADSGRLGLCIQGLGVAGERKLRGRGATRQILSRRARRGALFDPQAAIPRRTRRNRARRP